MYFLGIVTGWSLRNFFNLIIKHLKTERTAVTSTALYPLTGLSPFQFNLLFGWSIYDYRTFFSSAVAFVGLLMGLSNHKEVKPSILFSLQNSIWFTVSNEGKVVYKAALTYTTAYSKRARFRPFAVLVYDTMHTAFEWLLLRNLSFPKHIVPPASSL